MEPLEPNPISADSNSGSETEYDYEDSDARHEDAHWDDFEENILPALCAEGRAEEKEEARCAKRARYTINTEDQSKTQQRATPHLANMMAETQPTAEAQFHRAYTCFDADDSDVILLDTGASSNYLWETDYKLSEDGVVYPDSAQVGSADATSAPMHSKGRINAVTKLNNDAPMRIHNAMLLGKRLRQRLLSVGEQTNHGYSYIFAKEKAYIFYANTLIKTVTKRGNLYPLGVQLPGKTPAQRADSSQIAHMLTEFLDYLEPAPQTALRCRRPQGTEMKSLIYPA